jgi:hypothetical protein
MSAYSEELPNKVAVAWRKFLGTSEGQFGIDWLRRNSRHEPAETDLQMVRSAAKWIGYQTALDEIEDRLTKIATKEESLDEPPLEIPGGRD